MTHSWRIGLSGRAVELLRQFREQTGHQHSTEAASLIRWLRQDDLAPTEAQTMEFLWGFVPLYHRRHPEPMEDLRAEIADFLQFLGPGTVPQLDACLKVAGDAEIFGRRWRSLHRVPLPIWLEELRQMLVTRGLPSTVPAADLSDLMAVGMRRLLVPGEVALAGLETPAGADPPAGSENQMAGCAALSQVASLLEIVGEGTKLTGRGNLSLADGKALAAAIGCDFLFDEKIGDRVFKTKSSAEVQPVELVYQWSRAAGFVRVKHGRLLPTARGVRFGKDPGSDWWALFRAAVLKPAWAAGRWPDDRTPFWAGFVAGMLPAYLRIAAEAGDRGVALLIPAGFVWELISDRWVTEDLSEDQVRWQISWVVGAINYGLFVPLELLGAAETWEGGADESARVTQLGRWAAGRLAGELFPESTGPTSSPQGQGNVVELASRRARHGPAGPPGTGNGKPQDQMQPATVTINQVFEEYLAEEKSRLARSTFAKYQEVIGYFEASLNGYGYQSLDPSERELWEKRWEADEEAGSFCNTFGPDKILENVTEFLGYFLIRKVIGGPGLNRSAGTVIRKLLAWMQAKGYLEAGPARESIALAEELGAVLPMADKLASALYEGCREPPSGRFLEEWEDDYATIAKVEPGKIWFADPSGRRAVGPVRVARSASDAARVGWSVSAVYLVRTEQGWRMVEVGNIYPN